MCYKFIMILYDQLSMVGARAWCCWSREASVGAPPTTPPASWVSSSTLPRRQRSPWPQSSSTCEFLKFRNLRTEGNVNCDFPLSIHLSLYPHPIHPSIYLSNLLFPSFCFLLLNSYYKCYRELEEKGWYTGRKSCGSLYVAKTKDRMLTYKRMKAASVQFGLDCRCQLWSRSVFVTIPPCFPAYFIC